MTKALLCDIDGTLVQSNWLHAQAWKDAFAERDIQIGVNTGGWSREDLLAAGCIAVYEDVGDLLDHFDGSPLCR